MEDAGIRWVEAEDGYALALADGKLVCRNAKGKRLRSVPKKIRGGAAAEQLLALRDWLARHERECIEAVETWMLRSLPVPRAALEAVWDDPAWQGPLANAVITAIGDDGATDPDAAGFFRGVDPQRGVGVVNLDGETEWLDATRIAIPHPILLSDLDDYRELATELGLTQGIGQLFRETWEKPEDAGGQTSVSAFSGGKFEQLNHALGKCRTLGYRVRGGFAQTSVWEGGDVVLARYWIGADYPEGETYTGELLWVDHREHTVKLESVGPIAYSEGMRMASAIFAARVVAEEDPS